MNLVVKVHLSEITPDAALQLNIKLAVILHRSFQQSFRPASVRTGGHRSSGKMFFVAGAKNAAAAGRGNERR